MKHVIAHKFHFSSIALITVFFFISVQLRKEKLELPLSPEFEWITAHTLLTLEIWDEAGGPHAYNFNPVYTYDGKGNEAIGTLGGVMGEDRKLYYTSYPPFAFIFAYYGTKLLGGPDVSTLRTLGLIMHFFCALLIYFIVKKISGKNKDHFSIASIIAPGLYLFSAGTLWMHSIMYFSDTCVQLFFIWAIYLLVCILKNDTSSTSWQLLTFGIILFLGVYTEWIALFFAFFVGIFFLIKYFRSKQKIYRNIFLVCAISSGLSITITLVQYSSINGFDELITVSQSKYEERSGSQENIEGMEVYNWSNPKLSKMLDEHFNRNFAMVINLGGIVVFFLIPIILWKRLREKIKGLPLKITLLSILLLSVALHYVLFYNFNALHNFSNLKTGFLLILTIGFIIQLIEESLSLKLRLVFATLLLYLIVPRGIREVQRFENFYSYEQFNQGLIHSANTVEQYQDANKLVFVNVPVTPAYNYRAHHNVFPIADTSAAGHFMNYFQTKHAQFYFHQDSQLQYMLELEKSGNSVQATSRIDF